jgi:hypothetical protein
VSLSFLNKTGNKQVCRVCRAIAELKADRLCAECTRIKARLGTRFPDAIRHEAAPEQQCKRSGCVCAACDLRTLDLHPFYPSEADRRETHFHPRCHELWLEIGSRARPEEDLHTPGR